MRMTPPKTGLRLAFVLTAIAIVLLVLSSSGFTRGIHRGRKTPLTTKLVQAPTATARTKSSAATRSTRRQEKRQETIQPDKGDDSSTPFTKSRKLGTNAKFFAGRDGRKDSTKPAVSSASSQQPEGPQVSIRVTPLSMDKDLRTLPEIKSVDPGLELPEHWRHPRSEESEESERSRPATNVAGPFDAVLQLLVPEPAMPSLNISFDGIDRATSACNCSPPDTDGDVGPSHYIQAVNVRFEIFDKVGGVLQAATTFNTLWGTGGANPCTQGLHRGDPVVFYDHVADRWLVTDFAFGVSGVDPIPPYYQCVAVSKTSDPVSGGWWLYAFQQDGLNTDWLGDYPKYGVWSDAYYGSYNMFCEGNSCTRGTFQGVQVFANNRTEMIAGSPTTPIFFRITPAQLGDSYSLLPGTFRFGAPPAGRDEFFASIDSPASSATVLNKVHLWKFHVDFGTPANSTFTSTPTDVTVANFNDAFSGATTNIVPQPGTAVLLDTVGDRLFMNLWYQNLGGTESLWATHTINNTGATAVRWYQFNVTGGTVPASPVQQGSWDGGGDGLYRFMPSLSLDKSGNMALGYSASNGANFPSIRYNGRLTSDTSGTLGQGESTMIAGTGSQTSAGGRWGDYSAMSIDPTDGCSLWFTSEYLTVTGSNWMTRVGSFRYAPCVAANDGTLTGTVTDSISSLPIAGATVTATAGGVTNSTTTNGSGVYTFTILPGSYNMTAAKPGYATGSVLGVVVTLGNTTTQNFALVSSCSPVARTWVGLGAGGAGTDFNAAANWSPAGVPQPCDNLTMTVTRNNGASALISLSADSTVGSLTITFSGTGAGAANVFRLDVGALKLTINGVTTGTANSTSGSAGAQLQFNVGNGGRLVHGGNATFSASTTGGTGVSATFPLLGIANSTGEVEYDGNATFNAGSGTSLGNMPAKVIFNKAGSQTITDNAGANLILLGNTSTEIGTTNSPTVVVAGTASLFQPQGNLNVNNSSVLDLANRTFNRNAAGGAFTLANGATLKLGTNTGGQTGSNFPLNFTTSTLNTTSTVEYNGAAAQTIFATPPYGNLTLTGAAVKTAGAALTVNGNLTINPGATFAASTFAHSFKGNWTNSGTFTSGAQTTTFNGSAKQTITGATTFSSLTLANTAGGIDATAASTNLTVSALLTMNQATDLDMGSNILIMTSNTAGQRETAGTGQGEVVGTVRRTSFTSTNNYGFGSPFVRFGAFTFTGAPTQIDVNLTQGTPDMFIQAVRRTYLITVTGGTAMSTTLRLHYRDDANTLNGNAEGSLNLWRGPSWTDQSQTARDGANNFVEKSGVSTFSPWTLAPGGSVPTAVKLTKFNATSYADGVQVTWESGFEVNNLGYHIYREENGKRSRVTPSLIAGSALSVGQGNKLTAGYSYGWFDPEGTTATSYWLEAIDLNGSREETGPLYPAASQEKNLSLRRERAMLLGELASTAKANGAASRGVSNNGAKGWPAAQLPSSWTASGSKMKLSSSITQETIANGPAVKIAVKGSGWHRVTRAELAATGFDLSGDARLLQLYVDGEQVPIRLSNEGPQFNANDTLEFFAVGLDTPTTGTRVYYLIRGTSAGLRVTMRKPRARDSYESWTPVAALRSFDYTTERREKLIYASHVLNGDADNIFGAPVFSEPLNQDLNIRNFDRDATAQPQLEVSLQGLTAQQHEVEVQFNGSPVGTVRFAEAEHPTAKFSVNRALIREGDNTVSLVATNGSSDISFVDSLRLTYAHRYTADNNALWFSAPGSEIARVDGFTTPNIRVIDVTNPAAPVEYLTTGMPSGSGYAVKVPANGNGARSLLAFADELATSAVSVTANQPSNWHAAANGADLLIITHKDFRQAIEPLANQRRSEGMSVAVVDVEDVFDEYSYGAHTPAALKAFLAHVATTWSRKPAYLLLVGDSTWDPRNYLGEGDSDFVPTKLIDTGYMETASDDWLVDFAGTGEAGMAVGRLPGRTSTEVGQMVAKILAYQQERDLGVPLRGAVMVADSGFESHSASTSSLLPAGIAVEAINRSEVGSDDVMKGAIVDALNQGPMIVNYYGHGSVRVWTGAGVLDADLAAALTNVNKPSFYVLMTCLNGYASDAYVDSLGESVLKSQNGAAAVWASSGFTDSQPQFLMNQEFYRLLFGAEPLRLGEATRRAKGAISDQDVRRTWMLFGDPTMRLR